MSPRFARLCAFVLGSSLLGSVALVMDGCGSDGATDTPAADGATTDSAGSNLDGAKGDSSSDGGVDSATADTGANGKGETCIGFAKGTPCGGGFPAYGYVCFGGSPPGIAGCELASSSGSFGDTWCCTENKCVAEPDQDKECKTAGAPHRYQCPPAEGDSGATVPPPSGCADAGGGGSALERFYCCP